MHTFLNAALNPSLHILPLNVGVGRDDPPAFDAMLLLRYVNIPLWLRRSMPSLLPHLSFIKIDVEGGNEDTLESLLDLGDEVRRADIFGRQGAE